MFEVPINKLKPHPQNGLIYGDSFDDDLFQSIQKNGVTSPIMITKDFTIISGHRRWSVCKALKVKNVPVQEIDETDSDKLVELLIASNVQRDKSKEQKLREGEVLREIEDKRATERQAENARRNQPQSQNVENFPHSVISEGKARDIVATKIGMSGKTLDKGLAVLKAIDVLKETDPEQAKELTKTLNKSVSGAFKKVSEKKEAYVRTSSQAMQFAVIAISQLERIRHDDPKKSEALNKVRSWIENFETIKE
jgi:ParB family chromosome partitioning protein